jgi:histone chaperone ASF1
LFLFPSLFLDLEFKIIYVGSAETYEFDQTLDQIVVDAVPQGQFKFMFQADPPETNKIPADDAVGVTVILITASYREQEFVRVGYYVTNEYEDPEMREVPPTEPQFDKLIRTIASNEPRVTKFKINWDPKPTTTTTIGDIVSSSELLQSGGVVNRLPPPPPLASVSFENIINENNKENIINNNESNSKINGDDGDNYLQISNSSSNGILINGDDNMIN